MAPNNKDVVMITLMGSTWSPLVFSRARSRLVTN